ncbi:MAG: MFS transporter [Rhodospirillaceae bacterium]|nr:MFS transporter [Rhodospirillaceae bacterium]
MSNHGTTAAISEAGSASAVPASQFAPPGVRAWVALFLLCVVYVLNFLDRQLLSILAKPIQDELHITDGQIGLISGLYFALFYCTIAIPVGWLADRTNRVRLLSFACALWSAATVACGLAATYPQLVVARMMVGVGEAGGVPPSYAIISDYFPSGRRGTALGLYNLGPPVGQALGVAFGASIAAAYSWRSAFIVLGAVGIAAALVTYISVREPKRGGLDAVSDTPVAASPFWPTVAAFFARPILLRLSLACAATQFVTYGLMNFITLFLMREKGMTLNEIALYYALMIGLCMGGGIFAAGRLVDILAPRWKQAYAYVPAGGLMISIPFFLAFVWAPSWPLAMMFLIVPTFFNYFYLSPAVALVQEAVRPDQRVLSGALLLLVMNLVGLGFGPTFVGAMSDFFRPSYPEHSLQMALYALTPFYGVAIVLFIALARALRREAEAAGVQS